MSFAKDKASERSASIETITNPELPVEASNRGQGPKYPNNNSSNRFISEPMGPAASSMDSNASFSSQPLYKKIVQTIIPPLQSSFGFSPPDTPTEYLSESENGNTLKLPTENKMAHSIHNVLTEDAKQKTESSSPTKSRVVPRRSSSNDDEIDIACPIGELRLLSYFLNMLTTALVYAGVGNVKNLRKFVTKDNEHHTLCQEYERLESSKSSGEQRSKPKKKEKEPHFLAYGVFESSSSESEEDEPDNNEEDGAEEPANELQNDIQNTPPSSVSGSISKDANEHLDSTGPLDPLEYEKKNASVHDLIEQLAQGQNLDELYKKESQQNQSEISDSINHRKKSIISLSKKEDPSTNDTSNDLDLDDEEPHDPSTWTTFQKSIVENLDPHILKEGLLIKFKENELNEINQKKEEQTKKLQLKKEKLRLKIAEKLQKVFDLDPDDYFYCNYDNWLIMDVLLQGHLYLTRDNLLFFAFLPSNSGSTGNPKTVDEVSRNDSHLDDSDCVIHSGSLGIKTAQYGDSYFSTMITHRFWVVLREETLTVYRSPTDLYFPMFVVDLKTATHAEIIEKDLTVNTAPAPQNNPSSPLLSPKGPRSRHNSFENSKSRPSFRRDNTDYLSNSDDDSSEASSLITQDYEEGNETVSGGVWIKLVTKKKNYRFHTDNLYSARQWVNTITKVLFQLHNSNSRNEVLIKIPIENIVDFKNSYVLTESDDADRDEESPLSFCVKYLDPAASESSLLNSQRMKKKLKNSTNKLVKDKGFKVKIKINDQTTGNSIISDQTSNVDINTLYFLFFRGGEGFNDTFNQVIYDRLSHNQKNPSDDASTNTLTVTDRLKETARKMSRQRENSVASSTWSKSSQPMSTLSSFPSSRPLIIEQIAAVNERLQKADAGKTDPGSLNPTNNSLVSFTNFEDSSLQRSNSLSRLRRIGKTLTSPSKVFGKSKSVNDLISSDSQLRASGIADSGERSLPDVPSTLVEKNTPNTEHVSSVSLTSSPMTGVAGSNTIHLPRRLSVTGLKNLNMSFETSQRRMDVAESRYQDRDNESAPEEDQKAQYMEPKLTTANKSELFVTPLNLSDPSEYKNDNKKQNKVKSIGKTMKVLANVGNLWAAHPSHYQNIEENDPYYVTDDDAREVALKRYQEHFSLSYDKKLVATYYTHLQRAIPVYGKLYLSETELCFRSLLPGVNTRMILPLSHIENCYKEKGMKITHSGLVILIIGQEEVFLEFGSHKARDDCERMILQQLETFHQDEGWAPLDHRPESLHEFEFRGADVTNNEVNDSVASSKIQNARIKLFEDKLNAAAGIDIPLILEDSPFFKTEIKPSTSYNLTLLTIGSRGDVQPYIALAKGLKAEGHNVTIATHKEFEPWISKYNIQFKEIAGNPAELMHLMVEHGSMSVAFLKEASSKFRSWINDLLASSWEACQGTDILIESPSAMGGVHIAEALGIPYMRAFTMPWTRTRAYPHAFIVPDQKKGGSYNYLTHVMFENVFWKGISGQVNKWRVEQLGLPRTNLFKLQQTKIPFLYNVSPTIFPPSVDFPDWVKVTGYWFLDEGAAKDYDPPKDLLEFIDSAYRDQKKIVYIGFGSIVVSNATSLTKAVIEAVLDADVRCILNKGWSDRLSNDEKDKVEVELPPEIYDSGAVPHDWLFKRIDACVHHGGSGTTGASLRSGLPTVIKPFFGDQFFYASRVEEVGVGIALKKLNAKSLSKALKTVTTDLKIVEKAKKTSERMRNENGVATAIEAIYSELEYARTLITVKQQHNEQSRANALKSGTQTPVVYEDDEYESVEEGVDDDYDLGSESDYEEEISDESNQKTTPSSKNSPDSTKDPVQSADSDDEEDLTNPVPAFPKKKSDKAIHLPSNLKPENCQWFHF